MPAKDLGIKHTCWKCSTKFYDLRKPDPACPKCGSDPRAAPKTRPAPAAERRRKEAPVDEVAEPVEEAELDEEAEDEGEADDKDDKDDS